MTQINREDKYILKSTKEVVVFLRRVGKYADVLIAGHLQHVRMDSIKKVASKSDLTKIAIREPIVLRHTIKRIKDKYDNIREFLVVSSKPVLSEVVQYYPDSFVRVLSGDVWKVIRINGKLYTKMTRV